jgi:hypothetical protein
MAPRKTTRTRRPAAPKAPAPAQDPQQIDAYPLPDTGEPYDDFAEPEFRLSLLRVIIIGGLTLAFIVAGVSIVGGVAWQISKWRKPDANLVDDTEVDRKLYRAVSAVFEGEDGVVSTDALYFSRIFWGAKDRLTVDAESEAPVFDTYGEFEALVHHLGTFATKGNATQDRYPDLPELIESELLVHAFGGDVEDGPATPEQIKKFRERCGDWAAVLNLISKEN